MRYLALFALGLTAFPGVAPAQPATQTVTLSSFSFRPKPLHLAAGLPVTLTFVNSSGNSHDFTAKEFFAAARITDGAAPGGEIDLHGHQTKSVTLVPAAGTYKAHCSHFMHAEMGMTEQIVVN